MHHRHQGKDNRPDVANVRPMHSGICPLCLNFLALQATALVSQPEFQGAETSNKALQTEPTYFSLSGDASFASRLVEFSVRPHLWQHHPITPPDHTTGPHNRTALQCSVTAQVLRAGSRMDKSPDCPEQSPDSAVTAQNNQPPAQVTKPRAQNQGPSLTGVKSRMQNQFS
jgi:hypothetical protein